MYHVRKSKHTIYVAKTKEICTFFDAYEKGRFSQEAAQMINVFSPNRSPDILIVEVEKGVAVLSPNHTQDQYNSFALVLLSVTKCTMWKLDGLTQLQTCLTFD